MLLLKRTGRTLGKAEGKRRYDLPLNRGGGTSFLLTLMALMTFLAVLALAASFTLNAMTTRWAEGLEGQAAVEIGAVMPDGKLLTEESMSQESEKLFSFLTNYPVIADVRVMSRDEIQKMIEPWLAGGNVKIPGDIPLPGLIALTFKEGTDAATMGALGRKITSLSPTARLDTHEEWLNDILRFTNALTFSAFLIMLIVGVTAAIAVASAARARIAVHRAEVEILSLMGATDGYIAGQFQKHALLLALWGGMAGMAMAGAMLVLIGWGAGAMEANLLPDSRLAAWQVAVMALTPVMAGILAATTTRVTVIKSLARMS